MHKSISQQGTRTVRVTIFFHIKFTKKKYTFHETQFQPINALIDDE